MKQFYTNTINKLFLNKEYFTSIINRHEIFLEKKDKKLYSTKKLTYIATICASVIAVVIGGLSGGMNIAAIWTACSFIAFGVFAFSLDITKPFEKKNIRALSDKLAKDISDNPELLKDIYKLCVDKEATFKFNHLIDNIMHGKKDFAALEIFYKILDNYELHQEINKSNPVRDLFMNQLKIKEIEQSAPSTSKDKFLEML